MMTEKAIAADMVWTSLTLEARRLLLAYSLGPEFAFIDQDAQLELHERGLLNGESITTNGRVVVRDRS